jgi:hypothetical protein
MTLQPAWFTTASQDPRPQWQVVSLDFISGRSKVGGINDMNIVFGIGDRLLNGAPINLQMSTFAEIKFNS